MRLILAENNFEEQPQAEAEKSVNVSSWNFTNSCKIVGQPVGEDCERG